MNRDFYTSYILIRTSEDMEVRAELFHSYDKAIKRFEQWDKKGWHCKMESTSNIWNNSISWVDSKSED